MKTIKIGTMNVELFDAIEELPIARFHKFNKMILVDSGIGSDLSDFDNHIERAIRFCKVNPEATATELQNLRQNVYFIQSGISPKMMAFCVLVKSTDGEPFDDISDDSLKALQKRFEDMPINQLTAHLEAVKKKIDDELHLYFPGQFDDAAVKEYYDQLRRRTLLMLGSIISGDTEDKRKEIDAITMALITYTKPMEFQGNKSIEISYDKQFEEMCLILSQNLHVNPKTFTVLEYYNAFEFLKKQLRQNGANKAPTKR